MNDYPRDHAGVAHLAPKKVNFVGKIAHGTALRAPVAPSVENWARAVRSGGDPVISPCICRERLGVYADAARVQPPKWRRTNRQSWHQGAGGAVIEARHVPLDRRGTPRTCYLVVDNFGFANCPTVAPPALGDKQQGKAAA
jgi:hypothetical protein